MDPGFLVYLAIAVLVAVVTAVYDRLRRGRRLIVLRQSPPRRMRWVFWVATMVGAVLLSVLPRERFGPVGSLACLVALGALALCGYLVDSASPPPSGYCAFHERGVLFVERVRWQDMTWTGRPDDEFNERFVAWARVERFEWDGNTLVFHIASRKAGRPRGERSVEVPPERREEVMSIVVARVRG